MGKRSGKKKYLKYAMVMLAAIFAVSAALLLIELWDRRQGKFSEQTSSNENSEFEYNGVKYKPKDGLETFLVLGLDKYDGDASAESYNNDKQADFLMLFIFDNSRREYSALHINRDTMAEINVLGLNGSAVGTVTRQIALAHTYGNGREVSCYNVSDAVSKLLFGVKIDHYISVTMDSVPIINDLVGGVEVTVLDDFTGVDSTLVKGQTVRLTGEQALTYVRGRYGVGDGTNEARMVRQRQYMDELRKATVKKAEEDGNFALEVLGKIGDSIVSDRSEARLQELGEKLGSYEFKGTHTIEGDSRIGEKYMEFYPDTDKLKGFVADMFYDRKA